tara:strand:+ start:5940 stop:6632 length:693 start_codon:yes stop_codon:yes gene_type:complete
MTLQSSGPISMDDMRTEFSFSGSIAMNQLYRGGGKVPSSATTTVGASVANLTGSAVSSSGQGSFSIAFAQVAQFTSNMTCGNNGNVTANGNIVFTASGSGSGDNAAVMGVSGGVRIVSTDATTNAAGTLTGGTQYSAFSGSGSAGTTSCSLSTTISNGTSLGIPSGTTAFKILSYISVSKNPDSDNQSSASAGLSNPTSGAFTSTSTGNVNTGVPESGTISFNDLLGATA